MRNSGFSLVEVMVVVFVLGCVTIIPIRMLNTIAEARVVACAESMQAHISMTEQLREQIRTRPPSQQEMYDWMGNKRNKHYHYVPNDSDANSGHGNDLDICDEDNPGASLENRDCLDIKYIWVCDHNHGKLAKYLFGSDSTGPVVVPLEPITRSTKKNPIPPSESIQRGNGDAFLRELNYWRVEDPNLLKWIGR